MAEMERFELSRRFEPTYRISSYLEAKEPEFRRRILSSPRFRNHSHMLTPTHQPKRSQLRRYSVEKQSPFS